MRRHSQQITFRMRILALIAEAPAPLTGREIALRCDVPYKATIDALNALYNRSKVQRIGKKVKTRWWRLAPEDSGPLLIEQVMARWRSQSNSGNKSTLSE